MISVVLHLLASLMPVAHAVGPVWVWCTGLAGCGQEGEVLTTAVPAILTVLVTLSAGATVIFMVYGGFQMAMLFGDDGGAAKAKGTIRNAIIGLFITMFSAAAVAFVATEFPGGDAADPFVGFMQAVVRILLTLFNIFLLASFIYAGFLLVMGKEDHEKAKSMIKYAIIGAIVVNLARAIVDIVLGLAL